MLYSRSLNSFTHEPPVLARLESHTSMLPRCQDPQVHNARTMCRVVSVHSLTIHTPSPTYNIRVDIAQLVRFTCYHLPCPT